MLFNSSNSLIAFDKKSLNSNSFFYLNYIQNVALSLDNSRIARKSIGNKESNKFYFSNPDISLNISYFQRNDFLNERILGFDLNQTPSNSSIKNLHDGFFNKKAFIIFDENRGDDITQKIIKNNFTNLMLGISLGNLYLNSYSLSYSLGSPAIANLNFIFQDFKISNILQNNQNYYLQSFDDENYLLSKNEIQAFYDRTNLNIGKNIIYQMKNFILDSSIANSNAPIPQANNFLNGLIQNLNISIDFNRNKNLFFNKTGKISERNFNFPLSANLQLNGITKNFTENSINSMMENDKKFALKITIGDSNLTNEIEDYSEIEIQNLYIESFNYSIDINGNLIYSIDASFEINETEGFFIKVKKLKSNDESYMKIFSSDGHKLQAQIDAINSPSIGYDLRFLI